MSRRPESRPPRTALALLAIFALLAAAVLPHLGALGNGFVFDDRGVIVENSAVTSFDLGGIWSRPYWPSLTGGANLFRPLTTTSFAIDWALGGGRPSFFVATNLALHAITCLLAWALIRRLWPARAGLALAATLLFAVHPIHVEAVAGIVGRGEILSALLSLLAYRAWLDDEGRRLRARAGGTSAPRAAIAWALAAPALWLLALLAKEGSLGLPILLAAHRVGLLRIEAAPAERGPRARDLAWPAALAVAVLLRAHALGRLDAPRPSLLDNPLAHVGPLARALGAGGVLGRQLAQIVLPLHLSADYSYRQVAPGAALYVPGALVLAACAAGVIAAIRSGRAKPWGWGILFFTSFWIVTSNLLVPIGTAQADRLLYLPLLGLVVAACAGLGRLLATARLRVLAPWLAAALAGALVAAFAVRSAVRVRDWRDDGTLFEAAVRDAPRSIKARSNLAAVWLRDQRPETARRVAALLAPVEPEGSEFGSFLQRKAKVAMFLGERERARDLYRESLARGADSSEVWIELGNLAIEAGDGAEALSAFDAAARRGRLTQHVAIGRASALSILGRTSEAADAWLPIVAQLPDSVPVRTATAWNLREAGRTAEAVAILRDGIARRDDPRLWDSLARTLLASGRAGEAVVAARRAVELSRSEENRTTLALALAESGEPGEARAILSGIDDPDLRSEIEAALSSPR